MKAIFYDWAGLNVWLFHAINGWHTDLLDRFMLLGSALAEHQNFAIYVALMALAAIWTSQGGDRRKMSLWLGVIAVFSLGNLLDGGLIIALKEWFSLPRPPLALAGSVYLVGAPEFNLHHSFPSGHTSFAMLVSASLWPALNRYGKPVAAFFVGWVGLSRVSLGAHFPADVVGGALSCLLIVLVLHKLIALHVQH